MASGLGRQTTEILSGETIEESVRRAVVNTHLLLYPCTHVSVPSACRAWVDRGSMGASDETTPTSLGPTIVYKTHDSWLYAYIVVGGLSDIGPGSTDDRRSLGMRLWKSPLGRPFKYMIIIFMHPCKCTGCCQA